MKTTLAFTSLAALAACAPQPHWTRPHWLQDNSSALTANELDGPCRPITFIFARGSTEHGNMGKDVGTPLSEALKAKYGQDTVASQGVDYPAKLLDNLLPEGCDKTGINNMTAEMQLAATKCPNTQIVIGGYSQGAACTHAAVDALDGSVVQRIMAAVLFGDTKRKQTGGKIGAIPQDRIDIFCAKEDPVCDGTIIVGPGHFSYADDISAAVDFISGHLNV